MRKKYEINETLPLIILKIDYKIPDILIPIIGYEIYHPISKIKLNLTDCKEVKLNIPVAINEKNLFKHDPKSYLYTDDCSSYTTENGTDIILNDRKQEFKDNNLSLCENNCEYLGYNNDFKQSTCVCDIKNRMDLISEIIANPNKLSCNFENEEENNKNIISSIKCTKALFSKDGIINNISSYILFIIIAHFLLSIILFMKCGYQLLEEDITKIIQMKKNNCKIVKNRIGLVERNPKTNNNFTNTKKRKNKKIINFPQKRNVNNNLNLNPIANNDKSLNNKESLINLNKYTKKKKKINKFKGKKNINQNFNDFELNSLNYENELIYDKRTFLNIIFLY